MSDRNDENSSARSDLVVHASYELFILALLVVQLVNSFLYVFLPAASTQSVISVVSGSISIFLLLDSIYRLLRAKSKSRWFFHYYGYLVFLGSLPLPFFAVFRILQSWLALRKLQRDDLDAARQIIINRPAQNTLLVLIVVGLLIFEAASILVLKAEAGAPGSNIETSGDAMWWSIVTMATVGYGDKYPVTVQGRIVGVFVMFVGVGFFSVITSYLAHWFMQSRQRRFIRRSILPTDDFSPADSLEVMKDILDQQEKASQEAINELRSRLAELESRLNDKR